MLPKGEILKTYRKNIAKSLLWCRELERAENQSPSGTFFSTPNARYFCVYNNF